MIFPGIIDVHVHLRQPGGEHKENILSGTRAALAGGVIGLLDMPNNTPPITTLEGLRHKSDLFQQHAVCDYGLFAGCDGVDLESMLLMAPESCGLKLYLDETFGDLVFDDASALDRIFESWPGPGPVAIHGESPSIQRALELAGRYGQRVHICHVPHPSDLDRIEAARQKGVAVTCEVTPHHLFLNSDDARRLGTFGQMKPALVAPAEQSAFWEKISLVDCIGTDHAPHTCAEKLGPNPPPGVPGLETTLPLLLQAVADERLTLERVIEMLHINPLCIYGLSAPEASWCEVDVGASYALPRDGYITQCGWSPFVGQRALGRVTRTILRNETVWEEGNLLASPGTGQALHRP